MMSLKQFIKEWMLPIAMVSGASIYLIYNALPASVHCVGPILSGVVDVAQPLLLFLMLFLTFCRIEPKDLRPHRWHTWLLLIQGGLFVFLGLVVVLVRRWFDADASNAVTLLECAMLCMICPTATAAAVVTRKLGGDVPGITTYIVLINLLTAVLVPLVVPVLGHQPDLDFWQSFSMIMAKVFPLLITPCLGAWLVRYLLPGFHSWLLRYPDLPFYLWAVALTLAIALTTRAIVQSEMSVGVLLAMSGVSLVCCAFQFAAGRSIGWSYRPRALGQTASAPDAGSRTIQKITAGQSIGQKNTVFAIWLAYTFLTPETAIIGGLYSIWHNIYNAWQLRRCRVK